MQVCDAVQRNFTRSASTYDAHSDIQREVGRHLSQRLPGADSVQRVLEIGCGTGVYTVHLRRRFPRAQLLALDISAAMVEQASARLAGRGVHFEVGDVTRCREWGTFDLISANACLHWLTDLPGTLNRLSRSLAARGTLCISAFGPRTYWELAEVLQAAGPADLVPVSRTFPDRAQLERWLEAAFDQVQLQVRDEVKVYPSVLTLLRKIKYSGTQGPNPQRRQLTRRAIQQLDRHYRLRFDTVQATYETIYATARAKGTGCLPSS